MFGYIIVYAYISSVCFIFTVIRPGREPMSKKKPSESEIQASVSQSQSAAPSVKSSSAQRQPAVGAGRRSPGLTSRRAESPYSQNSESLRTQSPIEKSRLFTTCVTIIRRVYYNNFNIVAK